MWNNLSRHVAPPPSSKLTTKAFLNVNTDLTWPPEYPFSFEKDPFQDPWLAASRRIVIDGDPGAGKTTLSEIMARQISAKVISLDKYIPGNGSAHIEQIDCARLSLDILSAADDRVAIIEGVCILQIMSKIEVGQDYHIFLKFMNGCLDWELGEWLKRLSPLPKSKLRREVVQYYKAYRPYETCDTIGWQLERRD